MSVWRKWAKGWIATHERKLAMTGASPLNDKKGVYYNVLQKI
jgi:hypothetical protein